jgi:hypothetical protein
VTREEAKALRDRLGAAHKSGRWFCVIAYGGAWAVAEKELVYHESVTRARTVRIITNWDGKE